MKISKIFAGMSALAIASAMAITAFAANNPENGWDEEKAFISDDATWVGIKLVESGYEPSSVTHIKLTFTKEEDEQGWGGCIMFNGVGEGKGWQQDEDHFKFGNPGTVESGDAAIEAEGSDGTYTLDFDVPADTFLSYADYEGDDYYANVAVQQWWGATLTLTNVEITGDPVQEKNTEPESSAAETESSSQAANEESSSKAEESSSKAEESSKTESSKAESSKASTTTATKTNNATTTATSSAAAATDSTATDNTNQATGATAGLALAGLALAGAVAVVSKRK